MWYEVNRVLKKGVWWEALQRKRLDEKCSRKSQRQAQFVVFSKLHSLIEASIVSTRLIGRQSLTASFSTYELLP